MSFPESAEDWPSPLRGAVQRFGPKQVHAAGVEALGYPPAWIHSGKEAMQVLRALGAS